MLDLNIVSVPERFRTHPLFAAPIRGMNFGFLAKRGYYFRPDILSQPEKMAEMGVNWVTVNMSFCQTNFFSRKVFLDFSWSTGELELAEIVRRLHDAGIHVLFKPCLTSLDGAWMGSVAFPECPQIEGIDNRYWDEWFASFLEAETYFADLAARTEMDAMIIGAEYFGTEGQEDGWRRVIEAVRSRYEGPITYEFTYASRHAYPLNWLEEMDFLAYSYYPPAAPGEPTEENARLCPDYTAGDMESYLLSRRATVEGISARFGKKPVVFTEFGIRSARGCILQPYNFQWETPYDGAAQANYLQAALRVFSPLPEWMGLFWWKWDETQYRPHYHSQPGVDKGFTLQGKPAEAVWRSWTKGGENL